MGVGVTLVNPILGQPRQEDSKYQVNLDSIVRPTLGQPGLVYGPAGELVMREVWASPGLGLEQPEDLDANKQARDGGGEWS